MHVHGDAHHPARRLRRSQLRVDRLVGDPDVGHHRRRHTATATITNTYTRELGSAGHREGRRGGAATSGGGRQFIVAYDCGAASGQVTIADGRQHDRSTAPGRDTCTVQERPPIRPCCRPHTCGGRPRGRRAHGVGSRRTASTTLTVTNPTTPMFGQVRVTKAITGRDRGRHGTGDLRYRRRVQQRLHGDPRGRRRRGGDHPRPARRHDVHHLREHSDRRPDRRLLRLGRPTSPPATVTSPRPGQVVAATVTNPVVRVTGQLTIAKAAIAPDSVVDPAARSTSPTRASTAPTRPWPAPWR